MELDGFKILTNRYGFYAFPEEFLDRPLARDVFGKGMVYEPRTIEFIAENAGQGDVISGGAFVGDFFPGIARRLAPGAKLHSFEPSPRSFAAAQRTIALNRLDNVVLSPVAVGARPGSAQLDTRDPERDEAAAATARIVAGATPSQAGVVDVEIVTIDSLIPAGRSVSILHLDLEGYEEPALRGAVGTVTRCRPILILEGRKIGADRLNEIFPGCAYVEAGFFEKNLYLIDVAAHDRGMRPSG